MVFFFWRQQADLLKKILKYVGTCRNRSDELVAINLYSVSFLLLNPQIRSVELFHHILVSSAPSPLAECWQYWPGLPGTRPAVFGGHQVPSISTYPGQDKWKISRKGTLKMSYSGEGGSPA